METAKKRRIATNARHDWQAFALKGGDTKFEVSSGFGKPRKPKKPNKTKMNLEQSEVLVDRALVTLCAELPESLGLYNTARDQFTIGAIRAVPLLENVMPESRKHFIIRDWMRTYVEHEDQAMSNDISFDTLREIMKAERKQRARDAREKHGDLLPDDDDEKRSAKTKKKKEKQSNGKNKASINHKKKAAAAAADAKNKRRPRADESDESEAEADDSSTTSLSSDDSSDSSSSDDDDDRRSKGKGKAKASDKSKDKRTSKEDNKNKKNKAGKSNLPPLEIVLSSDEDDEPDALFDTDDPDVYEVETILEKRRGNFGEPDMYLIKWVGYEETTWEPADNVSKDLIEEFEGQPVRENEYVVEEILDRKTVRDKQTKLRTFKYFVKWVGYEDKTWEPAENLPHNLRRKFDSKYEARKRRRMS